MGAVGPPRYRHPVVEERIVRFKPWTVFVVLGIIVASFVVLSLLWKAREVLTWIVIALFLSLALNPLVEWLQARGIRRRGMAVAITMLGVVGLIAAIGAAFVPILVGEVGDFADAVPDYVEDLTEGRGPIGFLERTTTSSSACARRSRRAAPAASSAIRARLSGSRRGVVTSSSGRSRSSSSSSSCCSRGRSGSSGSSTSSRPSGERWRRIGQPGLTHGRRLRQRRAADRAIAGDHDRGVLSVFGVPTRSRSRCSSRCST